MADSSSALKYSYSVVLEGGPPWGIRLQGGHEFAQRLRIAKVNPNSKAYRQGVQTGDLIDSINGSSTDYMNHRDALCIFQNSNGKLVLKLTRTEKQSVIPVLRVESPAEELRNSESDFERVESSEHLNNNDKNNIGAISSGMASGYDDLLTSDLEMPSDGQSSTVVWQPNGYDDRRTFDLNGQNRDSRTRRNNSVVLSKGYESADDSLISNSFPVPVKISSLTLPSGRLKHPRHISDPGFGPKQSLRPPISDVFQLSRRSRQFNYWNHFYPRNFSDPAILSPRPNLDNPTALPNSLPPPLVFTSVEEFQKHYGSCYSRTLPLRKRYLVRPAPCQNGAVSGPLVKRVQFAPDDLQVQPLFYDSDDAITTFPRVAHPKRKSDSLPVTSVESRIKLQNEKSFPDPEMMNSVLAESSLTDPGRPKTLENLTSSLKIDLSPSNVDKLTNETKKINQKLSKDPESSANKIVNSFDLTLTSTDFLSPTETIGAATARLDLVRADLPKSRSSSLTLLKKNPAETTSSVVPPETVSVESRAAESFTSSTQLKVMDKISQSVPKASQSNITSIQATAKASQQNNQPVSHSVDQEFLDLMKKLSEDDKQKTDADMGQKDLYNQEHKTRHKAEQEFPSQQFIEADGFIPPRPKITTNGENGLGNKYPNEGNKENALTESPKGKAAEFAPCGIRYLSKQDSTNSNIKPSSANQRECFHSTLPASVFRNKEVINRPAPATDDRMLSPRFSDPTLVRDRSSYLFNDDYWLELAGLGNTCDRTVKPPEDNLKVPTMSSDKASTKAIALYPFKGKSEKELSFNQSDTIHIVRLVDKNWYEAKLNGVIGLVPCSYVKIIADSEEKQEKTLINVKAKHDFVAKFPAELPFNSGDILAVIRRIDDNWYEGRLDQRTGIFPVCYVEPLFRSPTFVQQPTSSIKPGLDLSNSLPAGNSVPAAASNSVSTSSFRSHNDPLLGLSKDVLEFDKLFENFSNLNATKTDDQKTVVNNNKSSLTRPNASWSQMPSDSKFNTISVSSSSIRDTNMVSDANPDPVQQKFRSDPKSETTDRCATPSLHLLYDEPWFQVLYNYTPQHDDELDLCEGDLIYLLEKCDDGWCVGKSDRTKRVGTFPGNYVRQLG